MKNYIKFKLYGLLLFVFAFASCETADQDISSIVLPNDSYPSVSSFTLDNTGPIIEGDTIYYTLSTSASIERSITFTPVINASETTLEEGVDFDIFGTALEPYSTEAKVMIITYGDVKPEEAGIISFDLTIEGIAEKYLLHPDSALPTGSVSVGNYISDNLDIEFAWDILIDGYPTSTNIDFDVFVADAEGYDNSDPWATVNWTDYAATGDHPEVLSMNPNDWGDGSYILFHDLWYNGFYGYPPADVLVPIVATFTKAGIFTTIVTQDESQTINALSTNGFVDDDGDDTGVWHNGFIAKVTIANGLFTITDFNDEEIASGKTGNTKRTPRPLSIIK